MPVVFILFVVLPIAEMWLLIEVGSRIGALPTIGLVLLTAMIGLALLRQQGFSTLTRAQQRMAEGQIPAKEMGEGIFLAIGGALLLTPGFITDAIGFACLIPGLRQGIMALILKRMHFVQVNSYWQRGGFGGNPESGDSDPRRRILDGEYRRDD